MSSYLLRAALSGLLLCGVLAGCNVFDGIGAESDDAQVLLQDARAALDRGDPHEAVRYLERAFELDPTDPEIRIELAGARFEATDLDLITLKGLTEHISGTARPSEATAAVRVGGKAEGGYCTFGTDPGGLDVFDYTAAPEYQQVRAEIETFVAARDLLDAIRPVDLEALPEETRAQWYLIRAFTRIALAVDAINGEVERIEATLYRVPGPQDSIGICAISKSALEEAEARIKCTHLPQILKGLDELAVRSRLLDEAEVSGLIDDLQQAVDVIGAQLNSNAIRFCTTTAGR